MIFTTPVAVFLMFVSEDKAYLAYYPLIILYGLFMTYVITSIGNSRKFKRNVTTKRTIPYYTFFYEKEEWNAFVGKDLKSTKKIIRKLTFIVLPIALLLCFIGTVKQDLTTFIVLGLISLLLLICFVFLLYIQKIKPLSAELNSSTRKIVFFNEGQILGSNHILNFYRNNQQMSLNEITIEEIDEIANLCFNATIKVYESGHDDDIIKKDYIPIPLKDQHIAMELLKLFSENLQKRKHKKRMKNKNTAKKTEYN
ncbi:hypothetical protein [Cellulophaga fucicola]|nr:hypothetical protein [Cellulophaga fucicola]